MPWASLAPWTSETDGAGASLQPPEGWGSGGVELAVILAGSLHAVHTRGLFTPAGLCTPQVRVGVGLIHCKGSKSEGNQFQSGSSGGLCPGPGTPEPQGKLTWLQSPRIGTMFWTPVGRQALDPRSGGFLL